MLSKEASSTNSSDSSWKFQSGYGKYSTCLRFIFSKNNDKLSQHCYRKFDYDNISDLKVIENDWIFLRAKQESKLTCGQV